MKVTKKIFQCEINEICLNYLLFVELFALFFLIFFGENISNNKNFSFNYSKGSIIDLRKINHNRLNIFGAKNSIRIYTARIKIELLMIL
jgi:hypothetical protein